MTLVPERPALHKPAIHEQGGESRILPFSRDQVAEFERPDMLLLRHHR